MFKRHGALRGALAAFVALVAAAALSPAAHAAITPSASTTTATPLAAGATGPLDLDLKFAPSSSGGIVNDSPKDLSINLPPGMLANAALDNGGCLTTAQIDDPSPCQIGSGDVTAYALGAIPITTPVNFYLVPPPAPGDLAGLAIALGGVQVGSTGAITIRPSGSSDGVGVSIGLLLPNSLFGVPIDITEVDSTFSALRYPATCPSTAAAVTVSSDSYNSSAVANASLPLAVSGCSSLSYSPAYSLSVAKASASSKSLSVSTTITEPATDSPSSSISLAFPLGNVTPSLAALHGLCADPSSGTCTPVGSVTAASPDYPSPLSGKAYLTGSLGGLTLTLVFPAPFPLTLVGSVDLKDNVTTFSGLPDIPLTSLQVTLSSGAQGLFSTDCTPTGGTSTASFVDQNGDKTAKVPTAFTIAGCSASSSSSSGSGSTTTPHLSTTKLGGLKTGKPSLRFTLTAARKSNLKSLTVTLPKGLSLRTHKVHKQLMVKGLSLTGGKVKSESVHGGVLKITLKKAAHKVTVSISSAGLKESAALQAKIKHKRLKALRLTVVARSSKGKRSTVHATIKNLA